MSVTVNELKHQIDCAMGCSVCETCITNARLVDVFTGTILENAEIYIDQGKIIDVGYHCKASAKQTIDVNGAYVTPGLIDAHVHIESSMLTPIRFARLVIPFGTTTIITDPHEIANVLGTRGIRYMMREAKRSEMTVSFMLPSCVPATPFETSGAVLSADDLAEFIDKPEVLGLAELMNVPGVVTKDDDLLKKVAMTLNLGKRIDGHSPLVSGAALSAYASCGVTSDHEASTTAEVNDRLSRGIRLFMREGSAAQNVEALSQTINERNARFFSLCTDDASPDDVYANGHMNHVVRRAAQNGVDPIEAIRMATINTALHFGLKNKGAVAPGFDADLVIFDDLTHCEAKQVWIAGKRVAQNGSMLTPEPDIEPDQEVLGCVKIQAITTKDFAIQVPSGKAHVIGLHDGDLVNDHLTLNVETDSEGLVHCKNNPSLLKLAVIERHHATGNIGLGLVKGFVKDGEHFGGAIASTIAHDSHNLVVMGDSDEDMLAAVKAIESMQGGLVLIRNGQIIQSLPLEIAGLMTNEEALITAKRKTAFIQAAHESFHVKESMHPIMTLSFLPLAVIPHLRVTDRGLFDVDLFRHIGVNV